MQFLYPSFLWALLSLIIPIIIHLFYFRRFKRVPFTNVRFLKEIKEETSSRSKLKNLLILLMRCLAIAALVFAFAQPYISQNENVKQGQKGVSIFIDNSSSMSAELENVPLLEIAKAKAREIVDAYQEGDKFQILTHDFEGKHQRLVSKEDAKTFIDEIKITPEVKLLDRVINRQKQVLKEESNAIFLLSDFQKSITNLSNEVDTTIELNLLPIQSVQEKNVSIDTAFFNTPVPILNQNNKLIVRINNKSNEVAERVKISFEKDGQSKPIGVRDIPANGFITDTVNISVLRPGYHEGVVKVKDFPIQFDDELFVSFYVDEEVKVLSLNENRPNKYLSALFDGIQYFKLDNQNLGQVQFQAFPEYDLILLNDINSISSGLMNELNQYVRNGGKLLVFPSASADLTSYNSFLSSFGATTLKKWNKTEQKVFNINTAEFVFNEVFETLRSNIKLPTTQGAYEFNSFQRSSAENLLSFRNKAPFLIKNNVDKGFVYLGASPLNTDYNDLALIAEVFVPMLYKMALAKATPSPLFYWIGRNTLLQLPKQNLTANQVYTIKGATEFIPGITNYGKSVLLDMNDQIQASGFYNLNLEDQNIKSLAFNYDRIESDLTILSDADLSDLLQNANIISKEEQNALSEFVEEIDRGIALWKWFIIAALIFLLIETVLIRLLKN